MIYLKNNLSIPIAVANSKFSTVVSPQTKITLHRGEYTLFFVDQKIGRIKLNRNASIGIFSDSFADVSTKSLFTDIANLQIFNPLSLPLQVFLNDKCFDVIPPNSSKYFIDGFNVGDVLKFCTFNFYLGNFMINDIFARRINIGIY